MSIKQREKEEKILRFRERETKNTQELCDSVLWSTSIGILMSTIFCVALMCHVVYVEILFILTLGD